MTKVKSTVTPMMAQFLEIKQDYPNALLFYRMGDFYELFFDDAIAAAAALDIALTKRGKHLGEDIPMCGVPFHAAENYLHTLISKGFRVAVCEQLESPAEAKKRGSKSVVKRGVTRLVTSGTLTEENLLSPRQHNFLASFVDIRGVAAFAWLDLSTGDMLVEEIARVGFGPILARINPSEVLVLEKSYEELAPIVEEMGATVTPLGAASFDSASAKTRICTLFQVDSLDGFGAFSRSEIAALGALADYLEITQKGKLPLLKPPQKVSGKTFMQIDAATRRNLELTQSLNGGKAGALLATIDFTKTAAGARLMETRLRNPSCDLATVQNRLDQLESFVGNEALRNDLRDELAAAPDIERALSRLSLGRGGPRDLRAIALGLQAGLEITTLLRTLNAPLFENQIQALEGHGALLQKLSDALVEEPPLLARDGGFVRAGYDEALEIDRSYRDDGRKMVSAMQQDYITLSGVTSLKVKHNNVLGYFIETPATHAKTMLSEEFADVFIHRQTTANAVRFTTVELSEAETKILNANSNALTKELEIYDRLTAEVLGNATEIFDAARALAQMDWASALAHLAHLGNYCRPKITNDRAFQIEKGRHPVVEAALAKEASGAFIPNDCDLSANGTGQKPIWLLTGPNMAGKSTFLRQNAIIAILAQMGSFVPAASAHIGLVSQLFSRVGASDDLARGRSTFMVEMVETAAILNQADENALVILDEIGRGTATYDGLSIAWATLENLHDVNKCRALFATHYHELTTLSSKLDGLQNTTVSVKEWEGEIIFLHEVIKGAADRSYGVQVAKLAGLPPAVIARAREVLTALESQERDDSANLLDELPLFNATPSAPVPAGNSELEEAVRALMPDDMTPKEALAALYELKSNLD